MGRASPPCLSPWTCPELLLPVQQLSVCPSGLCQAAAAEHSPCFHPLLPVPLGCRGQANGAQTQVTQGHVCLDTLCRARPQGLASTESLGHRGLCRLLTQSRVLSLSFAPATPFPSHLLVPVNRNPSRPALFPGTESASGM